MKRKHIVIAGLGFGGIYTYKNLPGWVRRHADITLVDQKNHFVFTPLLHEVASASLDDTSVVEPLRDILEPSHHFIQSRILGVDTKKNILHLENKDLSYDILVSSLGATTNTFGIPGVDQYCLTLKSLEDAVTLRNRSIDLFEAASQSDSEEERKKLLHFVIIGGGPTGVELAGEFSELFFHTFIKQYKNIHPRDITLTLINAGDSLLSTFHQRLRKYAEETLRFKNVIVRNNVVITEVHNNGVTTQDGEFIPASCIIWTAGVRAHEFVSEEDTLIYEKGKVIVDTYLCAASTSNVFVLGDLSLFPSSDGKGLPMTAQVAKQQGVHTGKNIGRLLKGEALLSFHYHESGSLASVGFLDAVADIKGVRFVGFPAWFLWRTIYLFNFASWKKRFRVMIDWTFNLFSGRDTTRL